MKVFYDTEFIEDGKTIDLISIGMVTERGDKYYAINGECDTSKASNWVKKNVLSKLDDRELDCYQYTKKDIRDQVAQFIGGYTPEFWAYYASYDWVVLCQLFGTMINLPKY